MVWPTSSFGSVGVQAASWVASCHFSPAESLISTCRISGYPKRASTIAPRIERRTFAGEESRATTVAINALLSIFATKPADLHSPCARACPTSAWRRGGLGSLRDVPVPTCVAPHTPHQAPAPSRQQARHAGTALPLAAPR